MSVAAELNYKPNYNAAALARGKTYNIGIVLPFITNHYFSSVVTGIYQVANHHGYTTTVYMTGDIPRKELSILSTLSGSVLDGVLICSSLSAQHECYFKNITGSGIPVVFFDRAADIYNTSRVLHDDISGAYEAVTHLIKNGYTKVAHITGPGDLMFTRRRLEGYISGLVANNIPVRKEWIIHSAFTQEAGTEDTFRLLNQEEKPDAIFAVNDRKAIGALIALKEKNILPGNEFGVAGFTNDPAAAIISPSLTTIEEPGFDIGRESCELLVKHMKKKKYSAEEKILTGRLIIRESSNRM